MPTSDFESGRTIPLQIPEPVWREWKINGVDADHLAELQAEYSEAMGYEFDWGQIIEEMFDGIPATDSENLENPPYVAVRWHFVLGDVYTAFLDGGGNLGELSDLATVILTEAEHAMTHTPGFLPMTTTIHSPDARSGDDDKAGAETGVIAGHQR